jgi:hypothetical protein
MPRRVVVAAKLDLSRLRTEEQVQLAAVLEKLPV